MNENMGKTNKVERQVWLTSASCWMNSLNSGLQWKVARWRLWNRAATEGVRCTSNLEEHINDRTFGLESRLLDAPDVEVSKKGVKKLVKLRLIVILRLRDPKLEAYKRKKAYKRRN